MAAGTPWDPKTQPQQYNRWAEQYKRFNPGKTPPTNFTGGGSLSGVGQIPGNTGPLPPTTGGVTAGQGPIVPKGAPQPGGGAGLPPVTGGLQVGAAQQANALGMTGALPFRRRVQRPMF